MSTPNPTTMTEPQRLDEIAGLLARGVQRFLADDIKAPEVVPSSQDPVDVDGQAEASCGQRAAGPRSPTP